MSDVLPFGRPVKADQKYAAMGFITPEMQNCERPGLLVSSLGFAAMHHHGDLADAEFVVAKKRLVNS